jgi:murein L,D-transpeptidase YcbB/YkuD
MNNKWKWFLLKRQLLLISCLILPLQVFSQQDSQHDFEFIEDALRSILNSHDHPYLIQPNYPPLWQAVEDLYFLSQQPLLWLRQENTQEQVADVLQMLETAEDSGLQSDDYDLLILKAKWASLLIQKNVTVYELALFDTALSISTLRYLADLHHGRIKPQSVNFGFPQKNDYDTLVSLILTAIQHNQILQLTEQAEPDFVPYRQLKQALKHYRQLDRDYSFPTFLFKDSLKEGDLDPQVNALKRKLIAQGELNSAGGDNPEDSIYQGAVIDAVKHFQRRHGLKADGIVGKNTLAALNTPFSKRIRQIELALERFRWLPRFNHDEPLIMVNIPAFQLWAFESGNLQSSDALSMKVIVGIARENQTPVFLANLDYLVFRPYWNVPKKITVDEILPKAQEDPDFLNSQNMELVKSFSRFSKPLEFTPDSVSLIQKGVIKVRQRPGRKNSLGLVKFIFPNKYAVYLHDTPAQSLFISEKRDFSHGCIRVEKPEALAEFILHSWYP